MGPSVESNPLKGLRVLGFCDYFAENPSGGTERVTLEVYRRLLTAGVVVEVVAIHPRSEGGVAATAGIPTHVVQGTDLSRIVRGQLTVSTSISRAAAGIVSRFCPDVVHVSGLHFLGSLIGTRKARKHQIPLVATAHVGSVDALTNTQRLPVRFYEAVLGRYILTRAAHIVAVSESVAAHISGLGAKRIHVIRNGVDHRHFLPTRRTEGKPRIVFVGRLLPNKGPHKVLEAYAALGRHDVPLAIVGDGPMRQRLEAQVQNLDIAGSVEFLGRLDDVAPVLGRSDIFVRPSTTEGGVSLSALEAMATGIPVVLSAITENATMIESGVSGILVDPNNASKLAGELARLLDDENLRKKIGDAGRELALSHSWDRCAADTGQVLVAAAQGDGPG